MYSNTAQLKDAVPCINYIWMDAPPIPMPANRGKETDGPIAMAAAIQKQGLDNKIVFWCLDEYVTHYAAILRPHGIQCRPIKTYLKRIAEYKVDDSYLGLISKLASLTLNLITRSFRKLHMLTVRHCYESFFCFILLNEGGYIAEASISPIPEQKIDFQIYKELKMFVLPTYLPKEIYLAYAPTPKTYDVKKLAESYHIYLQRWVEWIRKLSPDRSIEARNAEVKDEESITFSNTIFDYLFNINHEMNLIRFLQVEPNIAKTAITKSFPVFRKKEKCPQELLLIEQIKSLLRHLLSENNQWAFSELADKMLSQKLNALALLMYGTQQGLSLLDAALEMEKGICPGGPYEFFKDKSESFDDDCEEILKQIYAKLKNTSNSQAEFHDFPSSPPVSQSQQATDLDEEGNSALHLAVMNYSAGNLESIEKLLNLQGADFTQENYAGISPLHWVFELDHADVLELFLAKDKEGKIFNHLGIQIKTNCFKKLQKIYSKKTDEAMTYITDFLIEYLADKLYETGFSQILSQSFSSMIIPQKELVAIHLCATEITIKIPLYNHFLEMVFNDLLQRQRCYLLPSGFEFSLETKKFRMDFSSSLTRALYQPHGLHWAPVIQETTWIEILKNTFIKFESIQVPSLKPVAINSLNTVKSILYLFIPIQVLCGLILDYYNCNNEPGKIVKAPDYWNRGNAQIVADKTNHFLIPRKINFNNNTINLLQAYLQSIPFPNELKLLDSIEAGNPVAELTEVDRPITVTSTDNFLVFALTAKQDEKIDKEKNQTSVPLKDCKELVLYCLTQDFLIIAPNPYYWDLQLTPLTDQDIIEKQRLNYPLKPMRMLSANKVENLSDEKSLPGMPELTYRGNYNGDSIIFAPKSNTRVSIWQTLLSGDRMQHPSDSKTDATSTSNQDPVYEYGKNLLIHFCEKETIRQLVQPEIYNAIVTDRFKINDMAFKSLKDAYDRNKEEAKKTLEAGEKKLQDLEQKKIDALKVLGLDVEKFKLKSYDEISDALYGGRNIRLDFVSSDNLRKISNMISQQKHVLGSLNTARTALQSRDSHLWDYCLQETVYLKFIKDYWGYVYETDANAFCGVLVALAEILEIESPKEKPQELSKQLMSATQDKLVSSYLQNNSWGVYQKNPAPPVDEKSESEKNLGPVQDVGTVNISPANTI